MPELPEVETVRRMLESHVVGRTIRTVALSGKSLRIPIPPGLPRRLRGRTLERVRRHGKYLLIDLDRGATLLSHLGMSGRWLFHPEEPRERPPHVHLRARLDDGSALWFEDPRRFGMLKVLASEAAFEDPALAALGPDPLAERPTGPGLRTIASGSRVAVKSFLLDQRRIAGIGNIYASEILHRAGVDPRRHAGRVTGPEWEAIAAWIPRVLEAAVARMGTTFSTYRTLWNEPGAYGDQLTVYDRAGEPCRTCGAPIRRLVQAQRSTYYCPRCQGSGRRASTTSRRRTRPR